MSFGDALSGGLIRKKKPNLFSKSLALEDHYSHSYYKSPKSPTKQKFNIYNLDCESPLTCKHGICQICFKSSTMVARINATFFEQI